ncbi:hypothetical protein AX17_006080, partial [Amanita inopinata Kibby_2008]
MKKVHFEEDEGTSVDELTRKLFKLDVKDTTYTKAYAQLFLADPEVANKVVPPTCFSTHAVAANTPPSFRPQFITVPTPPSMTPQDYSCHFCRKDGLILPTG